MARGHNWRRNGQLRCVDDDDDVGGSSRFNARIPITNYDPESQKYFKN